MTFTNESAVLEFTWFIWAYYYIRCYQYYKKLGVKNFRDSLNDSYIASFGHRLVGLKRHEFELLPDDDGIKASTVRIGWGIPSRHEIGPRVNWSDARIWEYVRKLQVSRSRNFINLIRPPRLVRRLLGRIVAKGSRDLQITFRAGGFRAVIYPPDGRGSLRGQTKYSVALPFWMPVLVVAVYVRTALARPEFIENQGPLVLGLIPVWYAIGLHWIG